MNTPLKTAAILAALALSACGTTAVPSRLVEARTPTEHFQATAAEQAEEIALAINGHGLTSNQAAALAGYVDTWRRESGGPITVQTPAGGVDTTAAYRAGEATRGFLVSQGVPAAAILMAGYDGAAENGAPVRVAYARYQAVVPRCGEQWTNIAHSARNEVQPNFGCAITANMAAQIADPRDILGARPMTPADSGRAAVVFDHYRKGQASSTPQEPLVNGQIARAVE